MMDAKQTTPEDIEKAIRFFLNIVEPTTVSDSTKKHYIMWLRTLIDIIDRDRDECADVIVALRAHINTEGKNRFVTALDPSGRGGGYAMERLEGLLLREAQTCRVCSRSAMYHPTVGEPGILWCDEVGAPCQLMGNRCGAWTGQPKSESV